MTILSKIPNIKHFVLLVGCSILTLSIGYIADINVLQKNLRLAQEKKLNIVQQLQENNPLNRKLDPKQQHKISDNCDITDILHKVEKSATNARVELQLLEPQLKDAAFLLKLEIYGEYKNLLKFINNIFHLQYFAIFKELNLRPNNKQFTELRMQTLLNIYGTKSATTKNIVINLPEHDIFTKTISKPDLFLWSSTELTFLGVIQQNQKVYGFITDPMGTIYHVTVGDKLGLEPSKITAIDANGITITQDNKNQYVIH